MSKSNYYQFHNIIVTEKDLPSRITNNVHWVYAYKPDYPDIRLTEYSGGKWLIFERAGNTLDDLWMKCVKALNDGLFCDRIKCSSMSHVEMSGKEDGVICVYTDDENDIDEIKRVLKELRSIGIRFKICYKSNADTMNRIYGNNPNIIWSGDIE